MVNRSLDIHIVQIFGVNKNEFFREINTFIQQECIKLIKSDSQDIYNVIKYFVLNKCC